MSLFIGIDQSVLHTGICILDDTASVHYLGLIEPKNLKNQERLAYIRDNLAKVLAGKRFHVGVMEGYSYGSINKKYLLGEVGAVIKLALFDHCDKCFEIAPKQLKKYVTGRAAASKEEMIVAVGKQWNVTVDDDNIADAYGLSRIGYDIFNRKITQRYRLDVIKALENKDLKKKRKPTKVKSFFKDAV